jgi:hypothetical protein
MSPIQIGTLTFRSHTVLLDPTKALVFAHDANEGLPDVSRGTLARPRANLEYGGWGSPVIIDRL